MNKNYLALASLAAMASLVCLSGCESSTTPMAKPTSNATPPAAESKHAHGEHAAHGEGPHGGVVADWGGGKYHVEFTVDHDQQEATIYVLGDDEKTPTPVKAETLLLNIGDPKFQVELMPVPLDGEADGMCSRFVGKDEKLGVVQEFAGTISAEVDGTPYAGNFKEEPHGDHDEK